MHIIIVFHSEFCDEILVWIILFWVCACFLLFLSVLALLSGVRLEEYFYEKVQGKRPILLVDEGLLGQYMVQAGNQFDANTPYGINHSAVTVLWRSPYSICSVLYVQSLTYTQCFNWKCIRFQFSKSGWHWGPIWVKILYLHAGQPHSNGHCGHSPSTLRHAMAIYGFAHSTFLLNTYN